MTSSAPPVGSPAPLRLARIHLWLAVQSLVILLLSINRLSTLTLGYVAPNQFLRWVDLNNMLVLPLISVVAFYLLKKEIEYEGQTFDSRWHLLLNLGFVVGVYALAASYGDHEVTNYLHARFCEAGSTLDSALCRIVVFNDDVFSHCVFFVGFVLVNASLMFIQVPFPHAEARRRRDLVLLGANGLIVGGGLFANLAFETIGADLYVVAVLAVLALALLRRRGAQPLLVY